jgi:UDP-perosamine 4-acetyltransferase
MTLVLIGGGGHASVVADAARSAGFEIAGVLALEGTPIAAGFVRLGDDSWIDEAPPHVQYHVALGPQRGSNRRNALFRQLSDRGVPLPLIVASSANVSASAKLGRGTVAMQAAIINAGASVGQNCIVNTGALVEHDCSIGDHSHIAPRAALAGGVRIGTNCIIGVGAIILPGISVADGVTIGAGAVVVRSIDECDGTWSGNPARRHQ